MNRVREKRWAVIGEDGRHAWLGRHTDPTEEEITAAELSLAQRGMSGFLAITEGDYWSRRDQMAFLAVRELASPSVSFDAAVTAFEAIREATLAGMSQ